MNKNTKILSLSSLFVVLFSGVFVALPQKALACAAEPYLGSVCVTAASYCPMGYVAAAGQMSVINDNQALYSLLGTRYGGDGRNTYGIPDLRGRAPIGTGHGAGLTNFNIAARVGQEMHTLDISQMPSHTHAATFTPSGGASAGVASGNISLPVTGSAKIATSSSSSGSITPSDHAVLGKAAQGLGGVTLYSPAGTTADLNIGPEGGVTGTASGQVSLPVNLAAGVNGTVKLGYTGGNNTTGQTLPFPIVAPRIALTFCIATEGLYPQRP